ncbi:uncharacterized protein LOC142973383 [Anticarsia gemmatalis]|uniref:uncharacterized protein LOC142973383 n=1 Tax=Anticarsia gemmatalis TaxID=129554 RepID=UPI003F7601DC
MVVSAVIVVIVFLFIFWFFDSNFPSFIRLRTYAASSVTLTCFLGGVIIAALITTCILFWIKRRRDAAIRMMGSKIATIDVDRTVAAYHVSNITVKSEERMASPGSCASNIEPRPVQQKLNTKHFTEMEKQHYNKDRYKNIAIAGQGTPSQLESYC